MTESKWIEFVDLEVDKDGLRKTKVFFVNTKSDGITIGRIAWFARWRKYAFYPSYETVFETQCLKDIIAFIDGLMEERKKAKDAVS